MKETERKDKTTRKTDKKADGHLVLFVRRNAVYIAVFLIGAAFLLAAGSFDWNRINSYTMYNNDSRTFVRGRVVSVDNERLETDPYDHSRYLGEQELTVLILEGDQKGDKVSIDNYLSQTHNIYVNANQKIIVCADMPEGVAPYYTVFNYDRCLPLGIPCGGICRGNVVCGKRKRLTGISRCRFYTSSGSTVYGSGDLPRISSCNCLNPDHINRNSSQPVVVKWLQQTDGCIRTCYCTWSCSNRNYFLHKFKNLTSYRI